MPSVPRLSPMDEEGWRLLSLDAWTPRRICEGFYQVLLEIFLAGDSYLYLLLYPGCHATTGLFLSSQALPCAIWKGFTSRSQLPKPCPASSTHASARARWRKMTRGSRAESDRLLHSGTYYCTYVHAQQQVVSIGRHIPVMASDPWRPEDRGPRTWKR